MEPEKLYELGLQLTEKGKHSEAVALFLTLANDTNNVLDKAGLLLNASHAFKELGQFDKARQHLRSVRELLAPSSGNQDSEIDEDNRRGLLIGAELEDARISAGEDALTEAVEKLNAILATHKIYLEQESFAGILQLVRRDLAFLLVDLRRCEQALYMLEELNEKIPRDNWINFYLGYCYLQQSKYVDAREKLEQALQLGLPPDFLGRARCALGASFYELGDYVKAKSELEAGVKTASPRYVKEAGIWKWLEYTCMSLGLRSEAEHYRGLANLC
jgi:tetratricopeptide (TPR) repeat protein